MNSILLTTFLIVLTTIVYAIFVRNQRGLKSDSQRGIGLARRSYLYAVSFFSLLMASAGGLFIITFLLVGLFEGSRLTSSNTPLAIGTSLIIIGLPLWVFHWFLVSRHVKTIPVERKSSLRKTYLYVVMGIALSSLMASGLKILEWIFRIEDFSGFAWGSILIWSLVWIYHWRISEKETTLTIEKLDIRHLYVYVTSFVTLSMLFVGVFQILRLIMLELYDPLLGTQVVLKGPLNASILGSHMKSALSLTIVGSTAWFLHWIYMSRDLLNSKLRIIYLYITTGFVGPLIIASSLVYVSNKIIIWVIGAHSYQTGNAYFLFIPEHLSIVTVSICLWMYHKQILVKIHNPIHSAYYYILSFIGLITFIFSISLLIQIIITLVSDHSVPFIAGHNPWSKSLTQSIALGIVGAPLWLYGWRVVERRVRTIGITEGQSLTRRIYVFGLLSIGVLTLILSSGTLLFLILRDLFGTGVSADTLLDAKYSIAVSLVVSTFLPYHWFIYKKDKRTSDFSKMPQPDSKIKTVYMLSSGKDPETRQYFEQALGFRINVLTWVDPDALSYNLSKIQCQLLADQIAKSPGSNILIIPTEKTARIMSYD